MHKTSAELSSAVKNKIWITNGWIWNFHTFSNLYVHFGQIQYFFNAFKTNFTIKYFQYCVGTLSALRSFLVMFLCIYNVYTGI